MAAPATLWICFFKQSFLTNVTSLCCFQRQWRRTQHTTSDYHSAQVAGQSCGQQGSHFFWWQVVLCFAVNPVASVMFFSTITCPFSLCNNSNSFWLFNLHNNVLIHLRTYTYLQELAAKLMELVSVAPVDVVRDIITSLPEILEDCQHNDIARELKYVEGNKSSVFTALSLSLSLSACVPVTKTIKTRSHPCSLQLVTSDQHPADCSHPGLSL